MGKGDRKIKHRKLLNGKIICMKKRTGNEMKKNLRIIKWKCIQYTIIVLKSEKKKSTKIPKISTTLYLVSLIFKSILEGLFGSYDQTLIRSMEDVKKDPNGTSRYKNYTMSDMENILNGIKGRLDIAKQKINKLISIAIRIIETKTQKEKLKFKKLKIQLQAI